MRKITSKIVGWQDAIELVVALWLIASPFILGLFGSPTASATAILLGSIIFLVAQLGVSDHRPWEEWFNLSLAIILMISPWLLAYTTIQVAMLNAVISGGVLSCLALLALREEYSDMKERNTMKMA